MSCVRKIPLKILEEPTTYRNDYIDHKQPRGKLYKGPFSHPQGEKPKKTAPYECKDVHTMRPWRCKIPFDALWTPKAIIRTHPEQTYDLSLKIEDTGREESIKTRRRVYMLPAVSMDDIKDPKVRKLIIDNMYISDWKKISGEIEHKCTEREIPNTTFENPHKQTLRYPYDLIKHWPIDWEEKCKKWEEDYPKNVVDQTFMFWQDFKHTLDTPVPQDPLKKFVSDETRKEIRDLIDKDELRLAFDRPMQYYTGYRPRLDAGPFKKQYIMKDPYASLRKEQPKKSN